MPDLTGPPVLVDVEMTEAIELCTSAVQEATRRDEPVLLYSAGVVNSMRMLYDRDEARFSALMARLPYEWARELRQRVRTSKRLAGMFEGALTAHEETKPPRFTFLTVDELLQQPPPRWRVAGVIPERGLVVVWGASGSGKTFAVLDLCGAVARGVRWAGRRTKQGVVVYIAAEGQLRDRVEAWLLHHDLDDEELAHLFVLDSGVNLLDPAVDLEPLVDSLRDLEQRAGRIALIVIDTLNRVMPGGDENSPQDMGMVVSAAKQIEREFECATLFVHHSGKDEAKGSRGHSSLKAATDAEISVKRDGDIRTVTAEKVRDAVDGLALLTFRLQAIDLGDLSDIDPEAEAGERRTSCVVWPVEVERKRERREPTGRNQKIVLGVIRELMVDHWEALPASSSIPVGTNGIKLETLMTHAEQKIPVADGFRVRARITEAVTALQAGGFIGFHRPYIWLAER